MLDNCEHVIDAAATLAERLFQEAPGVHILATSREAMRVEGEHAYWLPPLESPPAVNLFLERAAASGNHLELNDTDASLVASICTRLDGIPLAIEFAAARVAAHGIAGTADLLKSRLGLQGPGRRTALPRHQTLHALLDWSYDFLTEPEQRVLRRLSIFVGAFSLTAAQAIASEGGPDDARAVDAVDHLVAKSLLSVAAPHGMARFRLLETTRVYALEKLEERGEKRAIALRHAKRLRLSARFARSGPARVSIWETCEPHSNGPSALMASRALAIDLAAGSAPIFLELSLLSECHKWSAVGIAAARRHIARHSSGNGSAGSRGGLIHLDTRQRRRRARAAIMRALEIAQTRGDISTRFRLLAGLAHVSRFRPRISGASLVVAEEIQSGARNRERALL